MKNKCQILFGLLLFPLCLSSCRKQAPAHYLEYIHNGWEFRKAGDQEWLPAAVPGSVHLDLLAGGIIKDPFLGMNEREVQWVENADWEYRTTLTVSGEIHEYENLDLCFEGLDTYADIYLNDSLLFSADNMFVPAIIPCKGKLVPGQNTLRVYFHSATRKGMEKMDALSYILPVTNEQAPVNQRSGIFSRKAPFHYGWDWGPRLVGCGIWKPVYLRAWNTARLNDLYTEPLTLTDTLAEYQAWVEIHASREISASVVISVDGTGISETTMIPVTPGINMASVRLRISNPRLWWTHGQGEPFLYRLNCSLYHGNTLIDSLHQALGVRKIELVQEPDSLGRSFYFRLNGRPVFMKGANYIPPDFFTTRVTHDKYNTLISEAKHANMNMLRVWGGAIYEDDRFYDLCDEHGLLVWQDFMFACAMPPGDSLYLANVSTEAAWQVKRLRNHPSLALWCGNNENLVAWNNWGWKESFPEDIANKIWNDYKKIFYGILPGAVQRYSPHSAYWASSPSSWKDRLPDRRSGNEHDWTIWFGQEEFENYRSEVPRFVSEYGLQALPAAECLESFTDHVSQGFSNPAIRERQRSRMDWIREGYNGNDMMLHYISMYFNPPANFSETIYLSQMTQALGLTTAIEAHRLHMPGCMGSLFWQLNDCWPALSWSCIDYCGNRKASYYHVRKAFAETALGFERVGNKIRILGISDRTPPSGLVLVKTILSTGGDTLLHETESISLVPGRPVEVSSFQVPRSTLTSGGGELIFVAGLVDGQGTVAGNFFFLTRPSEMKLKQPVFQTEISREQDGYLVSILADCFVYGVELEIQGSRGYFSDNFFHMVPGKKYEIFYRPHGREQVIRQEDLVIRHYNGMQTSRPGR